MSHLIQPIMIAGTPRCVDEPGFEGRSTKPVFTTIYKTADGQVEFTYGLSCGAQAVYKISTTIGSPSVNPYFGTIDLYIDQADITNPSQTKTVTNQAPDDDNPDRSPDATFTIPFTGSPCGTLITFFVRAGSGSRINISGGFISISE
jgi:hypothetical protein